MEDDDQTPGALVRRWRKAAQLSVPQLAAMVGTSRQNLDTFEKGAKSPRWDVRTLAKVMGYERLEDLLDMKPPPANRPVLTATVGPLPPGMKSVTIRDAELQRAFGVLYDGLKGVTPGTREAAAALIAAALRAPEGGEEIAKVLSFFMADRLSAAAPIAAKDDLQIPYFKPRESPPAAERAPAATPTPRAGRRPSSGTPKRGAPTKR